MRLFFALQPDPSTCLAIAEWRTHALPPLDAPVSAQNLHLTLAFLGEITERQLDRLTSATAAISADTVVLTLNQMGYWPKPGILWLGPASIPTSLTDLASKLQQAGRHVRAPAKQAPYQPHITLARRCQTPPPASVVTPQFQLAFDHFLLFLSERGRSGMRYTAIAEWPLA